MDLRLCVDVRDVDSFPNTGKEDGWAIAPEQNSTELIRTLNKYSNFQCDLNRLTKVKK